MIKFIKYSFFVAFLVFIISGVSIVYSNGCSGGLFSPSHTCDGVIEISQNIIGMGFFFFLEYYYLYLVVFAVVFLKLNLSKPLPSIPVETGKLPIFDLVMRSLIFGIPALIFVGIIIFFVLLQK